jgi:hypothetical protein
MQAHRIEVVVQADRKLVIEDIPFQEGQTVEVIILPAVKAHPENPYSLRGLPVELSNPFDPAVSADDWEANA